MNEKKEKPILLCGPMVRAILEGRKTVMRRVLKPQPKLATHLLFEWRRGRRGIVPYHRGFCDVWEEEPFVPIKHKEGDRLWVRETFVPFTRECGLWPDFPCNKNTPIPVIYRADCDFFFPGARPDNGWRPSIHMPRWASRITLEVTDVRAERLQEIREEDAKAEGCAAKAAPGAIWGASLAEFCQLWEQINGAGAWDANPWVWRIGFKRVLP